MSRDQRIVRLGSIDSLAQVQPIFMYVGNGAFHAAILMQNRGDIVQVEDWEVTLYRGPEVGRNQPSIHLYGFHPETIAPKTVRKVNFMGMLRMPLGFLGYGPNRPSPFMDTHPFFQAKPVPADILVQFDAKTAVWNGIKPLTEAGAGWLGSRSQPDGATKVSADGSWIAVPAQECLQMSEEATAAGSWVWETQA